MDSGVRMINYRELKFGIEIEFTGVSRSQASESLADLFETFSARTRDKYDSYIIRDRDGERNWTILRDNSIDAERGIDDVEVEIDDTFKCELVSPILEYSEIGVLDEMLKKLKQVGAFSNSSTGIHIHVSGENFDAIHLRVLCNMLYSKQVLLEKAFAVSNDRKTYCKTFSKGFIDRLNRKKPQSLEQFSKVWYFNCEFEDSQTAKYNSTRYQILNLHNLLSNRLPTVEYRFFNSSLEFNDVKAYIQFALLLTSKALNQDRASSRISDGDNEKWNLRLFLLRLGVIGEEFKYMRRYLLERLIGNSAWSYYEMPPF